MYTLEQLRIFVAVCELGSFSAVARRFKRAQSGISQAIGNLEIAFNQTLFLREKGAVTLTENGRALLPQVEFLLRQSEILDQKLTALENEEEHKLIIAFDESLMSRELNRLFKQIAERFPLTSLEIVTASGFDIENMVENGQVQLGVVYKNYTNQDAQMFELGYNRFVSVVGPEHELAGKKALNLPLLQQYRYLAHRSLNRKEHSFSMEPTLNTWYANSFFTLMELAQANIGWTDLPQNLAAGALKQGKLVKLDVVSEPQGNLIPVVGLCSRSHQTGKIMRYFIEMLKEFWPQKN